MSMFFLSNPTLIIKAGLSYCLGEGFGTQLSPNPATGQPASGGPYPPFPPASGGLTSFNFTAGTDPFSPSTLGYADANTGDGPYGTLNSGGGIGGNVLNGFIIQETFIGGHPNITVNLTVTGASSLPPQNFFTSLQFVDNNGKTAHCATNGTANWDNGTASYVGLTLNPSGNTQTWTWTWLGGSPTLPYLIDGTAYPVAVN